MHGLQSSHTIDVGGYSIPSAVLNPYVEHVVNRWLGKIGPLEGQEHSTYELERERERLHNAILDAIGLGRWQHAYDAFEKALEDYCDSQLPPEPPVQVHKLITPRGLLGGKPDYGA